VVLLVKIGPDQAEAEGFGGSKLQAGNDLGQALRRSSKRRVV
jgi:hypothetical protein